VKDSYDPEMDAIELESILVQKKIGREFRFIKDVLSSQVALVFRELDQALTDYISAFIPFQVRHEIY
jgi:hypothetical protein